MLRRIIADPSTPILIIAVALSLVLLIISHNERKQLGAEVSRLNEKVTELSDLAIGDLVPAFEMTDLQGKPARLSYQGGEPHILIIFSPDCTACKIQEFSVLNDFALRAGAKGYIVHGVSLSNKPDTMSFLAGHKADFEILLPDAGLFRRCYRISRVPQIVFIGGSGNVSYIHHGTLQEDGVPALMATLDNLIQSDSQPEHKAVLQF